MTSIRAARLLGLWSALTVLVAACAPTGGAGGSPDRSSAVPTAPKNLTIGVLRGAPDFSPFTALSSSTSARVFDGILGVGLTYTDADNVVYPLKAKELPSFEKGTWKLFDDGRMETTWYLRPSVFWHDGTPQTPEDYLFSFETSKDKDLKAIAAVDAAKSGITFPDPQTMVISWSQPFVTADSAGQSALPRHKLEQAYRTDKANAYVNSPHWTLEHINDGPYRIVRWELGADMDLERNDLYFEGRPPFNKVFVKVIGDPQALVSNILAANIDIVLPPGLDLDTAIEVKRRWEGTGNVVRADVVERIIQLETQFRPDFVRPRFGVSEFPVRQALYQSVDRQQMTEFMTYGFGPTADSYYLPTEPRRPDLQIPEFAYDPSKAPALLAQAGWRMRGPDGVLVHERTGERLSFEIWSNQAAGWDKLGYALADAWKPLGVEATVFPIPPNRTGDREYEAHHTSFFVTNVNNNQFWETRLDSRLISSEATRWVGSNRGGYFNPQMDVLYDRLRATIDPKLRTPIEREILQTTVGQLVMMPFYWETLPVLKLKDVKDHRTKSGSGTWWFYDFDKE